MSLITQDARVVTPKSQEVAALSRRIMVPPERIVKFCMQLSEIAGPHPSGAKVEFSPLYAVRFRCHICGQLRFLKNAIADHYLKVHAQAMPDDESLFCEPDFYAQRLEKAKPPKNPSLKRLRKVLPQRKAGNLNLDAGEFSEVHEEPGDELEDATWLQLLAVAETMVGMEQHAVGLPTSPRPQGPSPSSMPATWPMLARLSGLSENYCRNRIRNLLQDPKMQRLVSTCRYEEIQAARPRQNLGTAGRSAAKCLLFTVWETGMSWWKPEFLTSDVKRLMDCVFRQWQCSGLVSKYKNNKRKLPRSVRPVWSLTFTSKSKMYGRSGDFARLQDALVALSSTGSKSVHRLDHFAAESCEGTHVLMLSDLVARDRATLRAVWGDSDFYSDALRKRPPWQGHHEEEDEEEDDEELGTKSAGIQNHLQLTRDEPTLQSIRVALKSPTRPVSKFLKWLVVPEGQLAKILRAPLDPVDPQQANFKEPARTDRQEESEEEEPEEAEEDDDVGGDALPASSRSQPVDRTHRAYDFKPSPLLDHEDPEVLHRAFKEFAAMFLEMPANDTRGLSCQEQDLLDSAALVFKTAHGISKSAPESGAGSASTDFVLPGPSVAQLRASYHPCRTRIKSSKLSTALPVVLACLEELRLLVPFPCGQDFCEVLSAVAGPYCIPLQPQPPESTEASETAEFFSKFNLGRHWLWPHLEHAPLDCLRRAAACVLRAAGLDSDGALLQRCFLPCHLMAPCAWVHARGTLNVPVLRCLVMRLLQQLMKLPFASVPEQLGTTHLF